MRRNVFIVVLALLVALSAVAIVAAQEVTIEPTIEVTVGVTTEPTLSTTLVPTVETTAEPTADSTSEATLVPTSEATADSTMEPTTEATPESTAPVPVPPAITVTPVPDGAYVRIANFSPDAQWLDISLNGTPTVLRLPYPSVTEWIPVTPGSVTVDASISDGGAAVPGVSVETPGGAWTTVAIVGSSMNGTLQVVPFVEDYSDLLPSTGGLTFFNALEGSPELSFVKDDVVYFAQVGYPSPDTTAYATLIGDVGTHLFRAEDALNPAQVFAEFPAFKLPENEYTLIALIGTLADPHFFVISTDESAVEIVKGILPRPGTIMEALRNNENLTTFADALVSAGLSDMLSGSTQYTVIAPANFALDGSDTMSADDIATVLRSYIIEGKLTKLEIENGGTLTAIDGTPITATVDANGISVNGQLVIDVNIAATNGVIHMINGRYDSGAMQ